jgi:hypothetical protein
MSVIVVFLFQERSSWLCNLPRIIQTSCQQCALSLRCFILTVSTSGFFFDFENLDELLVQFNYRCTVFRVSLLKGVFFFSSNRRCPKEYLFLRLPYLFIFQFDQDIWSSWFVSFKFLLTVGCGKSVYADGRICLDILQNQWNPIYDVAAIPTLIQVSYFGVPDSSHLNHSLIVLWTRLGVR